MDRDPVTGAPVPADAIQRVLYLAPQVHIFRLPPGPPGPRGHMAATWTAQPGGGRIFTARLRLVETAVPSSGGGETVTATILLEDPATGELFAAAPYASRAAVEQAADSARFFAVRVVGPGGAKASLGLGFEQRPDAFDFGVALQDVRRVLGLEPAPAPAPATPSSAARAAAPPLAGGDENVDRTDWSLKEGETITISMGGRGRRRAAGAPAASAGPAGPMPFLPPPPSAANVRAELKMQRTDPEHTQETSQPQNPFDDDDFGDFH